MQKDILSEIITQKNILSVDINSNSILNLSTYNTTADPGSVSGKSAKLYLPIDSKIISATNTYIEVDYPLTFIIEQELPELPIIITTTENLIIPIDINNYNTTPEALIDRLVGSVVSQTAIIASATATTVTFNTSLSFTFILKKDSELETILDAFISSLNSTNPKIITRSECPTNNDFFKNYDVFTDIMISYKGNYKIEGSINNKIGVLNQFLNIDISALLTKNNFNNYISTYNSSLSLIYLTIDEWVEYFERLKKLMSRLRIVDAKIQEEEIQNLYDAKSFDAQQDIDYIYDVYLNNTFEFYIDYKQQRLFDIKID